MLPSDLTQLDTTVHGPVRLGVLTALQIGGPLDFTTLRKQLVVSDGALGVHLQKLEAAGYIAIDKSFRGRRPHTAMRLTREGRKAFQRYLDQLQQIVDRGRASPATEEESR